jgi:hypothetical protein
MQERSLKKTAQRLLLAQLKKHHLLTGKVSLHQTLSIVISASPYLQLRDYFAS